MMLFDNLRPLRIHMTQLRALGRVDKHPREQGGGAVLRPVHPPHGIQEDDYADVGGPVGVACVKDKWGHQVRPEEISGKVEDKLLKLILKSFYFSILSAGT